MYNVHMYFCGYVGGCTSVAGVFEFGPHSKIHICVCI